MGLLAILYKRGIYRGRCERKCTCHLAAEHKPPPGVDALRQWVLDTAKAPSIEGVRQPSSLGPGDWSPGPFVCDNHLQPLPGPTPGAKRDSPTDQNPPQPPYPPSRPPAPVPPSHLPVHSSRQLHANSPGPLSFLHAGGILDWHTYSGLSVTLRPNHGCCPLSSQKRKLRRRIRGANHSCQRKLAVRQ